MTYLFVGRAGAKENMILVVLCEELNGVLTYIRSSIALCNPDFFGFELGVFELIIVKFWCSSVVLTVRIYLTVSSCILSVRRYVSASLWILSIGDVLSIWC